MTTFIVGDPDSTPDAGDVLVYANERYVPSKPVDTTNFVENDDSRLSDNRNPTDHQHAIADVDGLRSELDGKQPTGVYALKSELPDVSGFITSDALSDYATESDVASAIDGIPAPDLSGYAETGHQHAITDVNGLQSALDGKQASGSYATTADLNGKQNVGDYALRSEVPSVTGLAEESYVDNAVSGLASQSDLDAKADSSALAALEARVAALEALETPED